MWTNKCIDIRADVTVLTLRGIWRAAVSFSQSLYVYKSLYVYIITIEQKNEDYG